MSKIKIIDTETGEILGDYNPKKRNRAKLFYITYTELIKKNCIKYDPVLISCLCEDMKRDNTIIINTNRRNEYSKLMKTTPRRIDDILTQSIKINVITRICKSVYMINPEYFSKCSYTQKKELEKIYTKQLAINLLKANI